MTLAQRNAILENINYTNDPRVRGAATAANRIENWDAKTLTFPRIAPQFPDDFGDGLDVTVPARVAVCPTCQGDGHHVNPSIDAGGLSVESFANDPDFAHSYASGVYRVPCYECKGRRVVLEVDTDRANPADLAHLDRHEQNQREMHAERLAEMRMGC